jgi:hypothetical protein
VLGLVLRSSWVKRLSHGVPIARLLVVGELALMARRHLVRLDRTERRRLATLLVRARGRTGTLTGSERRELALLLARLEPRLFLGSAIKRLSPVPVPKRLLYGKRGSAARAALALTRRT